LQGVISNGGAFSLFPSTGRFFALCANLGLMARVALLAALALCSAHPAWAASGKHSKKKAPTKQEAARSTHVPDGQAEARLIEVYQLIGQNQSREALTRAEDLVKQHPNFQLAQLVYGDLLTLQARPIQNLGELPDNITPNARAQLGDLREEAKQRIRAIQDKPPLGMIPAQFLQLSEKNRHAIAVDASRSRLYLFEHKGGQLHLVADYYVSVGKAGIDKLTEGDLRTPLGVYFVMGSLPKKTLKDFYGAGAMPLNYPNPFDNLRGKTGSGIWLHGTPPEQFSRAPKASDGCIVLTNPDLHRILNTVQARTTPVVIAPQLQWISPSNNESERQQFMTAFSTWKQSRLSGQVQSVLKHYTSDFRNYDKDLAQWTEVLQAESKTLAGQSLDIKDLSVLNWKESTGVNTMVVTFGELIKGMRTGPVKRQYWIKISGQWKIFFEGIIG
jgi:L,D-transpeptidase YnhG